MSQRHHATRRQVFFDLDGTLHRQDLFGCFLRFLLWRLPANWPLVLLCLPLVAVGLLAGGRAARRPISLLLWSITLGHSEATLQALEAAFVVAFRPRLQPFPQVRARLEAYLACPETRVWLLTGSPQQLVEQVYRDSGLLPRLTLIGTQIRRRYGGWTLTRRCLGQEKVRQLEQVLGRPFQLYSGYSDSRQDDCVLRHCRFRYRIDRDGALHRLP
ncbi:phosphatidylglycerophosphatase C [Edwardsiella tarda]|uniref:phosphatidylglycerophosphatase C n=1 Tax=Edwardsiella tarda TaxID=636 RepID=UPI0019670F1F|nr:phosphatidylglycerophosphatase C [Edwardsiella tarda]